MKTSTNDMFIIEKGLRILIERLGIVDTERFLALMNREKENYDDWRERFFGQMSAETYRTELIQFSSSR